MGLLDKYRAPDAKAIDPVCKMTVDTRTAKWSSQHAGQAYYFCSPGCKAGFEKDPNKFLGPNANAHGDGSHM